jgi:hypothetical protein
MLDSSPGVQEQDIEMARAILREYVDLEDKVCIDVREVKTQREGSIHVERSPWSIALEEAFEAKYGVEKGNRIANQVLTRMIIGDETIH